MAAPVEKQWELKIESRLAVALVTILANSDCPCGNQRAGGEHDIKYTIGCSHFLCQMSSLFCK
jgi:hypothetical protein